MMMLASPAFPPGGNIPAEYTCDGSDISPPLSWSGAPAGTKSFVLLVEDPDAPSGTFRHWAAFDIPPTATEMPAGFGPRRPAADFREAVNDFGNKGYGGPCPPAVLQAAQPYAIARTEFVGTYRR
jgi:Raf kinase inhibitor-like YbhB/YbcL family protein